MHSPKRTHHDSSVTLAMIIFIYGLMFCRNGVRDICSSMDLLFAGMVYVTSGAWEDALTKEKAKIKELEEMYNTKILENGVSGNLLWACIKFYYSHALQYRFIVIAVTKYRLESGRLGIISIEVFEVINFPTFVYRLVARDFLLNHQNIYTFLRHIFT